MLKADGACLVLLTVLWEGAGDRDWAGPTREHFPVLPNVPSLASSLPGVCPLHCSEALELLRVDLPFGKELLLFWVPEPLTPGEVTASRHQPCLHSTCHD